MILTALVGLAIMFVSDQVALQIAGGILMIAGLVAPLVRAALRDSNDDVHQSGQSKVISHRLNLSRNNLTDLRRV
jgi:hypothetical protein